MKLTKYEHSCVVLEHEGEQLIIDPGVFTTSLDATTNNVTAIVITHVHSDHLDPDKIKSLLKANPNLNLYGPEQAVREFPGLPFTTVRPDEQLVAGAFMLSFTGGQHAVIRSDIPALENIGVRINKTIYYPGDSFSPCNMQLKAILVPAAAPWSKVSEAIDFIHEARAEMVIPTHDAILSDNGKQIYDGLLDRATDEAGGVYTRLATGETIELN